MRQRAESFFATCPRGLEQVLSHELVQLHARDVAVTPGGVSFVGEFRICYEVNLHSRIASRVLWKVASSDYRTEEDVYQTAYDQPWTEWFDVHRTFMVKVSAQRCPLTSLDFATLRIKDAVCDKFRRQLKERPSVDTANPDIRIHGFLNESKLDLYLDTSGTTLFQRGLRQQAGEAPLRENLAAGILKLAGWEPGIPLLDPMCGSGTFLLEAVQIAHRIAPGLQREFAFEKLRNFDRSAWSELRTQAQAAQLPITEQLIYGSDVSNKVLDAAKANLAASGFSDAVKLKQVNIFDISAPEPEGILIANPPYGVRLSDLDEMAAFYPKFGDVLKQKFAGWRAYIFTGDLRLPKLIRLSTSRKIPLFNGGLECRLYEFKMVAGTTRNPKGKPNEQCVPPTGTSLLPEGTSGL